MFVDEPPGDVVRATVVARDREGLLSVELAHQPGEIPCAMANARLGIEKIVLTW